MIFYTQAKFTSPKLIHNNKLSLLKIGAVNNYFITTFALSVLVIIVNTFLCFNSICYTHSGKIASKKSFNDESLRELLTETCVFTQRVDGSIKTTSNAPFISPIDLNSWVREESELIIMPISHIVKCGIINLDSNPFVQELNDCANLKSRYECMEIGLDIVDPNPKFDLGMFLGIV